MGESCPKLLDLIPKDTKLVGNNREGDEKRHGCGSDDSKKLELRLGLPGEEGRSNQNNLLKNKYVRQKEESQVLSLSYFSPYKRSQDQKQAGLSNSPHLPRTLWPCSGYQPQPQPQPQPQQKHHHHHYSASPFAQYQTGPKGLPVMPKESQPSYTRIVNLQNAEKKAFSPASANTAVPNSSQKRAAPAPVVGWPPVRSFRKNLASTSSAKPASEPSSAIPSKPANEKPATENSKKGLFVKINMDGVPIGRKVDLNAYDSYEKLASAIDELFRGLLAAQRDSCTGGSENKQKEEKLITGLLDGSGKYTLVYEDNEGDRVLVGDVPWPMFVSTVKRLRVLKSSDLPTLNCGGSKKGKMPVESSSQ